MIRELGRRRTDLSHLSFFIRESKTSHHSLLRLKRGARVSMLPVGIFPNGQDEDKASGFSPSYTVLACPPMKKQGEFSISNLLLCLPYLTIPFGRVNDHTRQSRRFFHSGACRTRSDTTIITEICKRGTFRFTLDLMLANNLETGQPIQIS